MGKTKGYSGLLVADMGAEGPGTWTPLPHDAWGRIVREFLASICNGIAFDPTPTAEELAGFDIMVAGVPKRRFKADVEIRRTLPNRNVRTRHAVEVLEFDANLGELLLARPLALWSVSNPGTAADQLFFFRGERLIMAADTVDHVIAVYSLGEDELKSLRAVDPRIGDWLQAEKLEAETTRSDG